MCDTKVLSRLKGLYQGLVHRFEISVQQRVDVIMRLQPTGTRTDGRNCGKNKFRGRDGRRGSVRRAR